jgi:hypothetical protein
MTHTRLPARVVHDIHETLFPAFLRHVPPPQAKELLEVGKRLPRVSLVHGLELNVGEFHDRAIFFGLQ